MDLSNDRHSSLLRLLHHPTSTTPRCEYSISLPCHISAFPAVCFGIAPVVVKFEEAGFTLLQGEGTFKFSADPRSDECCARAIKKHAEIHRPGLQHQLSHPHPQSSAVNLHFKPESWNMTVLYPKAIERRKTNINHPRSLLQLFGVYSILVYTG